MGALDFERVFSHWLELVSDTCIEAGRMFAFYGSDLGLKFGTSKQTVFLVASLRQLIAEAAVWRLHFSKIYDQMFGFVILIYRVPALRA